MKKIDERGRSAVNVKRRVQNADQINNNLLNQRKIQANPSESPRVKNYLSVLQYPIGLRNIGNTCFLNSIIQFLYANEDMRNQLISIYGYQIQMKNARFSKLLGKLFFYLEEKSRNSIRIQQILALMANRLQLINTNYEKGSQGDALQTLLYILQEIQSKHPDIPVKLDIQYYNSCNCGVTRTQERVLSYSQAVCVTCNRFIFRTLLHQQKYIIYSNPRKQIAQQIKTQMFVQRQQNGIKRHRKLFYKLKAQIVHINYYRLGHYVTLRLENSQWFYLSDSHVSLYGSNSSRNGLILLYQLQNPETPPANSICSPKEKIYMKASQIKSPLAFAKRQQPKKEQKNKRIQESALNQLEKIKSLNNNSPVNIKTYTFQTSLKAKQEACEDIKKSQAQHKIQLDKNYQFKLKLSANISYSLFIKIWSHRNYYFGLFIRNKELLKMSNEFSKTFQIFFESIMKDQNQLLKLGQFFQKKIQQFISSKITSEDEMHSFIKQAKENMTQVVPDLVYNVQKNTIEINNLLPKQLQAKAK